MKQTIYVAKIKEDDYEISWDNIGCYSTLEKAENAIEEELRRLGETFLSLETYSITKEEDDDNYGYNWSIDTFILDE